MRIVKPLVRAVWIRLGEIAALMSWRGLRRFIEGSLGAVSAAAVVLNVGAGGRTAKVIEPVRARQGFQLISLDIDPARGPDIVADIITYAPQVRYDVIVMIEVLEHVRQPFDAVRNVHRLLKPGGRLVLSTPFLFPLHDRPMDFFRYTRYGLEELLGEFAQVEVRERDSWAEVVCVLIARLLRESSFSARLVAPFAVLVAALCYPAAMLLGRMIKADGYTSGYTVLATKSDDSGTVGSSA